MRALLDTDRSRQGVGSVKRRLMTTRAAHVSVNGQSRIEEQRPSELDALPRYRKLRAREILGQPLENLLRLFQQRGVLCRGGRKQDREARRDARRIKGELGNRRPPDRQSAARGSEVEIVLTDAL